MNSVSIGAESYVSPSATVGPRGPADEGATSIGREATIRGGTVIYPDVDVGDRFSTGHNAVVRSGSRIGDDVLVGTGAVVDGDVTVGSRVSMQTGAYVPPETAIADDVFLGPHAVVTNDAYPIREASELEGTTVESHASVGANATLLPGLTVGERSFVAAGAVVTEDVPPETLAVGAPAEHEPLPDRLRGENHIA